MRMCIIGAGKSGIATAKTALENNIIPTIYEQSGEIGGTWIYTDATTTNEFGLDVHSSMYQGLRYVMLQI